ncbi:MAG: permease-like cell division protein FtsX [Natronospirillum sp.]|uniref:permease-like cell division protein FtsX n=1 Tax=Natronospirillum sp. TaxID=2812955 RepID=UPI0025D5E287|nr:permease-like cell division protein FtsX [Natronospirillum sp.]MCH8551765.1 permease-like cell division protein FtsX [Natronospirillum sp.]
MAETQNQARRRPANRMKKRGTRRTELHSRTWLLHHRHLLRESVGDIIRHPFASALTWLVIAVALALPALLYVTQKNLEQLAGQWQEGAQVSLYLEDRLSAEAGSRLAEDLVRRPEVRDAWYLSRDDAMQEFSAWMDLGPVMESLDNNPLPATIVVIPVSQTRTDIEILGELLGNLPEVADMQMDIEWVQRLESISEVLNRALFAVSGVLGLTVVLVIGNTMRMATEARRDEIMVVKLVGATQSFVRRPFLYMGFWYGLFGGVVACGLTWGSLALLSGPVDTLAASYGTTLRLRSLTAPEALGLIGAAVVLSITSAWLTVSRRIASIEPNPI